MKQSDQKAIHSKLTSINWNWVWIKNDAIYKVKTLIKDLKYNMDERKKITHKLN